MSGLPNQSARFMPAEGRGEPTNVTGLTIV
jgi:hypothetical protein